MSANLTLRVVEDLDGEMFGTQAITAVAAAGGGGLGGTLLDDFNRANSGTLGSNWTITVGAFLINSNQAAVNDTGGENGGRAKWIGAGAPDSPDQYVMATLASSIANRWGELALRYGTSGNFLGYYFGDPGSEWIAGNGKWSLSARIADGSIVTGVTSGVAIQAGDTAKAYIVGQTLTGKVWHSGNTNPASPDIEINWTDSGNTVTATGSIGLFGSSTGSTTLPLWDDFKGGNGS